MSADSHASFWPDQWQRISISELAIFSGCAEGDLHELVAYGVLVPVSRADESWAFHPDCVLRVRKAARLRDDLELDLHAVALAISLLDRIDGLEQQLTAAGATIHHRPIG